jgi:hypothetical protein
MVLYNHVKQCNFYLQGGGGDAQSLSPLQKVHWALVFRIYGLVLYWYVPTINIWITNRYSHDGHIIHTLNTHNFNLDPNQSSYLKLYESFGSTSNCIFSWNCGKNNCHIS